MIWLWKMRRNNKFHGLLEINLKKIGANMSNKVSIMQEMFKKEGSDELVPAVTIILDGQIRNIIDALSEQNGYEGYPEAISEILFKGIESMIKK